MTPPDRAGAGLRLLAERIAAVPIALGDLAAEPNPDLDLGSTPLRGVRTTGIGSSEAHARYLAARIDGELAIPARFEPVSALASPPRNAGEQLLVLFSQGLSPNVWPLLESVGAWRKVVLVTAVREGGPDPRSEMIRRFAAAGGEVRRIPGENEYGTLMRVIGPAVGYLETIRLTGALSAATAGQLLAEPDVETLRGCASSAERRLHASLEEAGYGSLADLDHGIGILAFGRYAELLHNLQCKILEGMLLPLPPVWDLLAFAHGPFQQVFDRRTTLLALMHAGDPRERRLLERLRGMLVPDRHRLVVLESALPGDLAIFDHEALLNQMALRYVTERGIDPARWPGQNLDGALYESSDWAEPSPPASSPAGSRAVPRGLGSFTWPELEHSLSSRGAVAILPLGATEQHGAHLPFDTDSRIATALAERLCGEIDGAVQLPTIQIGCSVEHRAFPGTLSIDPATLVAILEATAACVRDAGFARLFLFSAHGGNYATLREALPRLQRTAPPLRIAAFLDLDLLTRQMWRESARHGISPEVAGHHAGEIETSILLALDPGAVRRDAFEEGFVEPVDDPQALFYPSLRRSAPRGIVGDPRRADAVRGARYLETWIELLAAAYRGE